ncbi:MAG: hypothetical protein IKS92_01490, partial [Victivallales bacterium]|nr:hypothetical protein [Victivallales bacterium]
FGEKLFQIVDAVHVHPVFLGKFCNLQLINIAAAGRKAKTPFRDSIRVLCVACLKMTVLHPNYGNLLLLS